MTDLTDRTIDYLIDARMESSGGRDHRADLVQAICHELAALRGAIMALAGPTRPAETTAAPEAPTDTPDLLTAVRSTFAEDSDTSVWDLIHVVRDLERAEAIRDAEEDR